MRVFTILAILTAGNVLAQDTEMEFTPARFLSGKTPDQPPLAAAGGSTTLELDVAASGIVTDATVLDEAEPFSSALEEATTLWRFRPAETDASAVATKVLVVGVFRPPVLMGAGVPEPTSVHEPSDEIPYPVATATPEYPPNALYEGVAVVEVAIDETGTVLESKMLSPEQGFDDAALDAASQFRFRPAHHDGRPVTSFALLFFGFRQPLTTPRIPRH